MRRLALILLVAITGAYCLASEETVASLKSRLENASPDERAEIAIHIAEHRLREADKLYIDGHADDARAAIDDVVAYSEKSRDAANQSKKHQKNIEIAVRKMSERLRDIKHTLAAEDQPPVDQAIRRMEEVRTSLLSDMFKKKDKK
jgi:hypothetical protein